MATLKFATENRHVGRRIAKRRTELGLTQTDLALKLRTFGVHIDQGNISECESGKLTVSVPRLYWIARALNVRPDYFFVGLEDTVVRADGSYGLLEEPTNEAVSAS